MHLMKLINIKMKEMIENFDEALSHPNEDDFIELKKAVLQI